MTSATPLRDWLSRSCFERGRDSRPARGPLVGLPRLARRALMGACLALPLACLHVGDMSASRSEHAVAGMVLECPVGSAGCPCTGGGGCDLGLVCVSGTCSYGGDDGDYGSGGSGSYDEYEFEDDVMMPAPVSAEYMTEGRNLSPARDQVSKRSARKKAAFQRDAGAAYEPAPPAAMPAPEGAANVAGMAGLATGEQHSVDPAAELSAQDRQVVYTAGLAIAVYELDAAIAVAEELPERWGGWIESRYDYQITLRLPAERLFEAITELSELGLVLDKTLRADDVTAEYTDLEGRILVLEQMVARLEELLAKATSVEQALEIRVELDRIRIELEAARVRMRQLAELIDFSTLTLYFSQRGPDHELPSSNDPFPWVDSLGTELTEYR